MEELQMVQVAAIDSSRDTHILENGLEPSTRGAGCTASVRTFDDAKVRQKATSEFNRILEASESPTGSSFRASLLTQASLSRTISKLGGTLQHIAALVVAESPVEAHREFLERQREEEERRLILESRRTQDEEIMSQVEDLERQESEMAARRAMAVQRWQNSVKSIMASARLVRCAEILGNPMAHPAERFVALVELEMKLAGNPHKLFLMTALERKVLNRFDSFLDHLLNELFITGERIFNFFTPAKLGCHKRIFTCLWLFVSFVTFAFMIGAYPFWILQSRHKRTVDECVQQQWNVQSAYGPASLLQWISPGRHKWCWEGHPWALEADYLIIWGARWGPLMRKDPYRWFTSWFLHQNYMHVLSNMLLFSAIAFNVEEKYGCWRITLLWFLSALGGNFFSAVFENSCIAVVGSSGGVFGMFGLFIADIVMNFESIRRPILQTIVIVAFLVLFIVTVATSPLGTSHLSHVGGFICGLFPSFLFLPNLRFEKWEAWLPIIGGIVTSVVYIGLPVYYYLKVFPNIGDCDTLISRM